MHEEEGSLSVPGIVWLLAVMLVLGLGAVVVFGGSRVVGHTIDAKRAKAASDISELKNALNRFRLACDRYPTTKEGLTVLIKGPGITGWSGPYSPKPMVDPWGNPYIYKDLGGDEFEVLSYGADRSPGGIGEAEDIGRG